MKFILTAYEIYSPIDALFIIICGKGEMVIFNHNFVVLIDSVTNTF